MLTQSQQPNKVCELLLASGADIESKDKTNATPLHRASGAGHRKCVRMLLDKGASVNAKDHNLRTPLHEAATEDRGGNVIFPFLGCIHFF